MLLLLNYLAPYIATTYQEKEWNLFVIIFSVIVIDLMFLGGGLLI